MANQMIEKIETDGAKAVWRMYQATNGVISGLPVLSADEDRITRTLTTKYCNSATGTAITDGLDVGITGDGTAEIRQRENLPVNIYVNNQLAQVVQADLNVRNTKNIGNAFHKEIGLAVTSTFAVATGLTWIGNGFSKFRVISGGHSAVFTASNNIYGGNNIAVLVTGATVQTVTPNSVFSFRLGDSTIEIKFDTGNGAVSFRVASGTVTTIDVYRVNEAIANW